MSSATERVGRYQLLEPIGIGPSGSVSRAKVFGVAGFERQFAVKRFHHELTATPAMASALSTAARGYGSLEHPRIARMSEFGVAQGTTFTAVEYVAGLDALRLIAEAKLQGQTLAAGGALALVSQAARAIGYAHGRGLTHLGLAPTNVIVTAEGDIKITDFGILAASLPQRPIESVRLAHRIQYLAPEQLANEATSAATDVFALGVLAYELVTGQRTFRGETAAQIAQSVMNGPPSEPPLPRPIVRVLQRCLARSPFERFPDARALADALDAALRVAPVPGTRKDIGAQVQQTIERISAMNEGELSGMLALDVGTGPITRGAEQPAVPALGRDSEAQADMSTLEFVRPDAHVPGPTPLVGPATLPPSSAATMPEMQKPFTTVPGLAPPPVPVPQGISTPPPSSLTAPSAPIGTSTLLGMQTVKSPPAIPLGKLDLQKAKRPATPPPGRPTPLPTPRAERPSGQMEALDDTNVVPPPSPPAYEKQRSTEEMSPLLVEKYNEALTKPTTEVEPLVEEAWQQHAVDEFPDEAHVTAAKPAPAASARIAVPPPTAPLPPARPAARSRAPWLLAGALGVAVLGLGGWWTYNTFVAPDPSGTKVVSPTVPDAGAKVAADAAAIAVANGDAGKAPGVDASVAVAPIVDAGVAVAPIVDAGVAVAIADAGATPLDAAVAATTPDAGAPIAPTPSDQLVITSTPSRARVFLDGADVGATPLKLPGTPDRHTIAVLMAGHELYVAQVDGHGAFAIPLKEVTPMGGPAGIKVTRCKDKDRYYVFVDGKPTGMTCPTERIEVELGPHVVEVYDVVSDSRKKFDVDVKDTRLSVRVKIE